MSDRKTKFHLESSPDNELFEPPEPLRLGAHLKSLPGYHQAYDRSTREANEFWLEIAKELHFEHFSEKGLEYNFDVRKGRIFTHFLNGSTTNMAYNCLERVIAQGKGSKIAYKFEGNEPNEFYEITYEELLKRVVNCAAVLRSKGVKKGDAVGLYLPMILELPICMLACARIGAMHAVIFAGFSADSVSQRLIQANAKILITADSFARGPKIIKLKDLADEAIAICHQHGHAVQTVLVIEHSRRSKFPDNQEAPEIKWNPEVDCKWSEEMEKCAGVDCPVEWVDAEHSSFVLYTSGSTGVPKGILHTTAGYMTYAYATMKYVFDAKDDDVYWCTADCGWITGHTYVVYGPLLNGVTSVIYEGIPTYPNASRNWELVQRLKITTLYTSPTAVRALMGFGNENVTEFDRSSLKIIGTVGEPINPTAWLWLYEIVGQRRVAVVDTYWQTETGGHVITPIPGAIPTKPGSATLPFFGVRPMLLDNDGRIIEGPGEGNLCFAAPWPGISRSILGDHERYEKVYYKPFAGFYFTGDGARRDHDGYYWITGRVDDLMNVSGHLLSTAEIESALSTHSQVVEAAVVSAEHPIKGHSPYAFVVLRDGQKLTPNLVCELKLLVREVIGAFAVPDNIQFAPGLPKTRSGKVTRRILRKIAEGDANAELGDISTLVDSNVIGELWKTRNGQNG